MRIDLVALSVALLYAPTAFAGECGAGKWGVADPIVRSVCDASNPQPVPPTSSQGGGTTATPEAAPAAVNRVATNTVTGTSEDVYDLGGQNGGNANKVAGTNEVSTIGSDGADPVNPSVKFTMPIDGDGTAHTAK